MSVLLCPDKFKGSLDASQVCDAIARGLRRVAPHLEILRHPMADGGDGSLDVLAAHLALDTHFVDATDPLGRPLRASYRASADTAFVELASATGLVLLKSEERDPERTSSYGTGLLLRDAIQRGYRKIVLLIGGSATNDAGMGIATALGIRFLDGLGAPLAPSGKTLQDVVTIDRSGLRLPADLRITALCDVTNPFHGPQGAAYVYAQQKGATAAQIKSLDQGLVHFATVLETSTGTDVQTLSGAGAAGGIGGGLAALLGAELRPGFETLAELTQLEARISRADLVLTGEGCLDAQSLDGKVIGGVAGLCRKYGKPLEAFVGTDCLGADKARALGIRRVHEVRALARDLADAMQRADGYLEALAAEVQWPGANVS